MAESDEAELAATRLEAALERIERQQSSGWTERPAAIDRRIPAKLDNLIRALRTALDG